MTEIEELLDRLKELDPETYMEWDDLFEEIYDISYGPLDWDTFKGAKSLLFGVIQDAIAADDRFLGFEIEFYSYFDVKYEATIFCDGTGSISVSGYGETAADAILAAYIAAREAEK